MFVILISISSHMPMNLLIIIFFWEGVFIASEYYCLYFAALDIYRNQGTETLGYQFWGKVKYFEGLCSVWP